MSRVKGVGRFPGYLSHGRVQVARIAALLAVIGGAFYLSWRGSQLPGLSPFAWGFFVAEFFTYLTLASAVPLMWTPRPRRWAPLPKGSLDVYVTVCGEDPAMVEATVRAALDIDYPHETYVLNDGRLADLDGWEEVEALADRMGVACFTRTTGARGKAGNLNHALEHTDGEFVAVIDADHLARPDLADDLLGHFHPRVAFVATRQDFRIDTRDYLGNSELFFYGVIQPAKDADNAAFSCGNGVVYRRDALADIGGFSEWNLVEDLHTSYQLHARGWQSVYVPRSVTTGTAPATAAEMAAQRLRWATDSLRLFFWDNPFLKRGLTGRQKVHYAQTTGIYYLATAFQITFLVCPSVSLLFGLEVIDPPSTPSYVAHLALFIGPLATMLVAFAGWRGALRLVQMQSFLAPVFCLAAFRALRMRPGRKAWAFSGVTRKSRQQQVNRITLVQHLLFALLLASVGYEIAREEGIHWGAVVWALLMASTLATQNSMVSMRWETAQSARIALTAPVVVAGGLVLIAIWAPFPRDPVATLQASSAQSAPAAQQPPQRRRRLQPPRRGVYLGTYEPDVAYAPGPTLPLRRYDGANLRILHRFQQWWGEDRYLNTQWAEQVAATGAAPMITWEPWRKPPGTVSDPDQHPGLLRDIADGRYDRYLTRWARDAAAFRRPILVRFMHEMNGSWYPWRAEGNGNTPDDYQAAFRHVHRVFTANRARNVSWVWSIDTLAGGAPTSREVLDTYYPGDRFVDWIGLSGFNWGPESVYPTERSFEATFKPSIDVVSGFGKPVMLSEIGTSAKAADPAGWLQSALDGVADLPSVKSIVWFDADTPDADFRLRPPSLRVIRDAGETRRFTPRLRARRLKR